MHELPRYTSRKLPVLLNNDQDYVIAKAEIFRRPDTVLIQITSSGADSQLLAEFLEQAEPIALSFGAIPVQNVREKRETT